MQKDKPSWSFKILTQDAWEPNMKMWDYIIKKHFPDVKFVYCSEEGGNGFYVNSDYLQFYFDEYCIVDLHINYDSCSETVKNILNCPCETGSSEYFEYCTFESFCNFLKTCFKNVGEITTKEDAEKEIKRITDTFEEGYTPDTWCYINRFEFETPENNYGL